MFDTLKTWLGFKSAAQAADSSSSGGSQQHYRGARVTRTNKGFQPSHRSGDAGIQESWNLLTARVRDLGENNPVVKKAKNLLPSLVVGSGMQAFADARDESQEDLFEEFNAESDLRFQRWCEDEADAEGRMHFGELQALTFKETVNVGNGLMLICQIKEPGRRIPLCLQGLEWEQLDRAKDRHASPTQNKIVGGIEYGARNQAVAYHVLDAHPYDNYSAAAGSMKSQRIPASRVLHWYLPGRWSAYCGISWFNAMMQSSWDLDWYLGNEMMAAGIGALLTAVVKQEHRGQLGLDDGQVDDDPYGNDPVKLGNGLIAHIGKDDKVEVIESTRPNRDAAPFIKLLMQLQAMSLNVSYLRLTGDYSQTNYTSARGAHLDDSMFCRPLQGSFGSRIVLPVRRLHDEQCAGLGLYESVTPRQYAREKFRLQQMDIIGVGREQLDPEKETDSAGGRMRMGLSTLKIECALRGLNWRDVLRQLAIEKKTLQRLGIVLDFSKGNGGARDQTTTDGDPQDEAPAAEPAKGNSDARGRRKKEAA